MITIDQLKTLQPNATILASNGDRYRLERATANIHDCWFWLLRGQVKDTNNGGTVKRAYDGSPRVAADVSQLDDCFVL
ncbi:hypothetical protein KAR91_08560 [Candidatus Pacearchaeota archaeon]|nr:hypothetical protein [Candidatus Pacearchaeota archaeon]